MCGIVGAIAEENVASLPRKTAIQGTENPYCKIRIANNEKYESIPQWSITNILNFIKLENHYCRIKTPFQRNLKEKISDYSEIARKVNVYPMTVTRLLTLNNYWANVQTIINIAKLFHISGKQVYENIISIKTHDSFPLKFDVKNLISPSLFRVIGYILADGGIHGRHSEGTYRPFYASKKEELIGSFEKDIVFVFGKIGGKANPIFAERPKKGSRTYKSYITSEENIIDYSRKVIFLNSEKKNKLEMLINSYGEKQRCVAL